MNKKFNINLEALRGFCALVVLLHHAIVVSGKLSTGFKIHPYIGGYTFPGHMMVLIFFMLSGYVIGLNYEGNTQFSINEYLKKRFLRLYPIYLFSIILTICFFQEEVMTIVSTIFFMQNIASNNLVHNGPLWSLNHEVIYYILAIPILKYKIKLYSVFLFLLIIIICLVNYDYFPNVVGDYSIGFFFWLTGFAINSYCQKEKELLIISGSEFSSLMLLLISCDLLSSFGFFFPKSDTISSSHIVRFGDFSLYIYCVYAILFVTVRRSAYFNIFTCIVYLSCWTTIIFWFIDGTLFQTKFFYIPLAFFLTSNILMLIKNNESNSVKFFSYVGSISYAIYVVHAPILFIVGEIHIYDGRLISYLVKVILLSCFTIITSIFLEKILQLKIKMYFSSLK